MSDNILFLIPTDATFVPEPLSMQEVEQLLISIFPQSVKIDISITDSIEFIATGVNIGTITCPGCGGNVDVNWWIQAIDTAYTQTNFENLVVEMPCCGQNHSLNNLDYEWPTGFARFKIEICNPEQDIDERQIRLLESILACRIKKVWSHF